MATSPTSHRLSPSPLPPLHIPPPSTSSPNRRDTTLSLDYYFASPSSGGPPSASGSSSYSSQQMAGSPGWAGLEGQQMRPSTSGEAGEGAEEVLISRRRMGDRDPHKQEGETWLLDSPNPSSTNLHSTTHPPRSNPSPSPSSPSSYYPPPSPHPPSPTRAPPSPTRTNRIPSPKHSPSSSSSPQERLHKTHRRIHVIDLPGSSTCSSDTESVGGSSSGFSHGEQGGVYAPRAGWRPDIEGWDGEDERRQGEREASYMAIMGEGSPSVGGERERSSIVSNTDTDVTERERKASSGSIGGHERKSSRSSPPPTSGGGGEGAVSSGSATPSKLLIHRRGHSHTRLAFVAPADMSSKSLEELQAKLSATKEGDAPTGSGGEGRKGSASSSRGLGGVRYIQQPGPMGGDEADREGEEGSMSAPAGRSTFRLGHRRGGSRGRSEDMTGGGVMDLNDPPGGGLGQIYEGRVTEWEEGERRSPIGGDGGRMVTPKQGARSPWQAGYGSDGGTPRARRSGGMGSQVISPTAMVFEPVTPVPGVETPGIGEGKDIGRLVAPPQLMGLGFGDVAASASGGIGRRGTSPEPPPKSSLRTSPQPRERGVFQGSPMSGSSESVGDSTGGERRASEVSTESADGEAGEEMGMLGHRPARTSSISGTMLKPSSIVPIQGGKTGKPGSPQPPGLLSSNSYSSYGSVESQESLDRRRQNSIPIENISTRSVSGNSPHRLSLQTIRRQSSILSIRSNNTSPIASQGPTFTAAQSRPWPASMVLGQLKSIKQPGERARVYARAINELIRTETGLGDWSMMVKTKAQHPKQQHRSLTKSKGNGFATLGVAPLATQHETRRDFSGMSNISNTSDAPFPIRADATVATELKPLMVDPNNPPDALPPLPYPQLQIAANQGMKNSASSASVKTLGGGGFGGGLFAALGRRQSVKRERPEVSGRTIGAPIPINVSQSSSSGSRHSLELISSGIRQTSVPPPSGPREKPGSLSSSSPRMDGLPLRSSLDAAAGLPRTSSMQRGSFDISGPRKLSAPATGGSVSGISHAVKESDMRGMQEVLPHADPRVLENYLRKYGNQIDGIGAYLEDEKASRVQRPMI